MSKGSRHREARKATYVPANTKNQNKQKRNAILITVASALVFLGLIALIIVGTVKDSGVVLKNTAALEIAGEKINADELEYYYNSILLSYRNYDATYKSYGIENFYGCDFNGNLFKQPYLNDEYPSWGDFIRSSAIEQVYLETMLEKQAKEAGFTLSDDEKTQIDATIKSLETSAKQNGTSMLYLLKLNYGKSITVEKYRSYIEREMLTSSYAEKVYNELNVEQSEIDAEYAENKDNYDVVNFSSATYTVTVNEGETVETVVNAKVAEIKSALETLTTEEAFNEYIIELTKTVDKDGNEVTKTAADFLQSNVRKTDISDEETASFLFNASRKLGDYRVTSNGKTITIIYFLNRDDQSYLTKNFRTIFLASASESETVLEKLEGIKSDWESGLKTAESFATFAKEHSQDPGTDDMGLYENVAKEQTRTEIDRWLYNPIRKDGDYEIIYSEDNGYHLMYYIGEGMPYRDVLADATVRQEHYDSYIEDLKEATPIKEFPKGISLVK